MVKQMVFPRFRQKEMVKNRVDELTFDLVWFDSLGAKSSCTLVKTPEVNILIDPGAAEMQPSFPAPKTKKIYWLMKAELAIKRAAKRADMVVISHYHHDHFMYSDELYKEKLLLAKNPNDYINDSQRKRAERFFDILCRSFGKTELENVLQEHEPKTYNDPLDEIPHAREKDFGDYNKRRRELFQKGLKWFQERVKHWNLNKRIPELKFRNIEVKFAEGKKFKFGQTKIHFTPPLFHGIEFSRVGWIFATVIEWKKKKLIHTSDIDGPTIEDYADWIILENPDVLIIDGPLTYTLGYTITRTTLNRTVENAKRIVEECDLELMIYDHHLPREPKFREHTREVWEIAKREQKNVLTAAEYLGKKPVVL